MMSSSVCMNFCKLQGLFSCGWLPSTLREQFSEDIFFNVSLIIMSDKNRSRYPSKPRLPPKKPQSASKSFYWTQKRLQRN